MYQALLSHCKMLESCCEQFQKAKERGCTDLASITAATSYTWMPYPHQSIAVRSVVTPFPTQSVLQKAYNALHAMATATS